jgi:hypothetical protein
MIITTLTRTTTHSTFILISISRSLFRSTIHMTGITLIIMIVFAITIGILIMVALIPEGSLVSLEVGSRSEG